MNFVVPLDTDLSVTAPLWPLAVQAGAVAWLLLATLGAYVRGWGLERRGFDWAFGAFVLTGLVAVVVLCGPIAAAGAWRATAPLACAGCGAPAAEVFGPLIAGATALAAFSAAVLAIAAARIAFGRWPPARRAELAAGIAALALGVLTELPGVGYAAWLAWIGPLPGLTAGAPARVHVGHTVTFTPELVGPAGWVAPPPITMTPDAPSVVAVPLVTTRGPIHLTRTLHFVAGRDAGPAAFPLRVGNRWFYHRWSGRDAGGFLFDRHRGWHRTDEPVALVVEIVSVDNTGPLRTFVLRATEGARATEHRLYAWDGQLYAGDEVVFEMLPEPATADDGTAPCHAAWIDIGGCRCLRVPSGDPTMPPGPLDCRETSGGNVVGEVVRGFVALFTLGLVDTGGTSTTSGLELTDFQPGPEPPQ